MADEQVKKSVVKIIVNKREPNFDQLWQMKPQESAVGSGCVIEGNRILTNAHVVSNQIYIEVCKPGQEKKYQAKVACVAHDCDLAILSVEDKSFFEDTVPPEVLEALPDQAYRVKVFGFPIGGNELSITAGIVSRLEAIEYAHSRRRLVALQIDAAMNPGNSGGPVFWETSLIGISFQIYSREKSEGIGSVIPMPMIQRFLKDIKDGKYDGIPFFGVVSQPLTAAAVRQYYKLKQNQTGVLVTDIYADSSAAGIIKKDDIITSVDNQSIGNEGKILSAKYKNFQFHYLVDHHLIGENMKVDILREGQPTTVTVPLKAVPRSLFYPQYDVKPDYYIFAGMIFTPLTQDYFDYLGKNRLITSKLLKYYYQDPDEIKSVVLISKILDHPENSDYHEIKNAAVMKVNGIPVSEMKDVIEAFQKPTGPFRVVEVDHPLRMIVLQTDSAVKISAEILNNYDIPSDRSASLRATKTVAQ